jgi:hypothetical protein
LLCSLNSHCRCVHKILHTRMFWRFEYEPFVSECVPGGGSSEHGNGYLGFIKRGGIF